MSLNWRAPGGALDATTAPQEMTPRAPIHPAPLTIRDERRDVLVYVRGSPWIVNRLYLILDDRSSVPPPEKSRFEAAVEAGVPTTFDGKKDHTGIPVMSKKRVAAGYLLRRLADQMILAEAWIFYPERLHGVLVLRFKAPGTADPMPEAKRRFLLDDVLGGTRAGRVKVWTNPPDAMGPGTITINLLVVTCPRDEEGASNRIDCTPHPDGGCVLSVAGDGPYDLVTGKSRGK